MQRRSSSSVRVYYPRHDRGQVVEAIAGGLAKLKQALPVKLLVLFGSYARGNYTVSSDIDLLVVYQGPRREEAYVLVRKALGIPGLEPHVYSQEEYAHSKEMLEAMTAKGMVLYQEGGGGKRPIVVTAKRIVGA